MNRGMVGISLWAARYAARRWGLYGVLAGFMLLKVGLEVLKPWPVVWLVDHVLQGRPWPGGWEAWWARVPGGGSDSGVAAWCVGATMVLFLAGWCVGLGHAFANISFGQRLVYDLAGDLLTRLQQLSLRFHARHSVGDQVRRLTTDAACVATIVRDAFLPVVSAVLSLAVMFAILWGVDARLALFSLVVVPLMGMGFWLYAEGMVQRSCVQQEAESRIYEVIEQTFWAMPMVQAFGCEGRQDARFRSAGRGSLEATLDLTRVQLRFKLWMGLSTGLGTALVLWMGARHVLAEDLSVGAILLFLSYLSSLYAPLETVMYTSSTLQGAAGSARRVLEILETQPDVRDRPGARALPAGRGRVRWEQVSFGYEPGRPVLQDVTLEVAPGEILALVGPTGAGKSTLLSLVPRFHDPWSGRVCVEGVDVREVRLKSLRSQVGLVLQDPFLFPISVAANIAYARPEAGREEIEAAARAAQAHEFILRLPQGYQTVVGERGVTLSGGERQRLSIARALLKNAPILILDEPTSALDVETEKSLMVTLPRLMENRTTLLIAHRLSTVRHAHRIVVLAEGRICEIGTHESLVASGGLYARWQNGQSPSAPSPPREAEGEGEKVRARRS